MKEILIFGHQNPDTDTIMSSIAMANLENKKGNNVVACKLGSINKETKYALEYFKQEEPKTIEFLEEGQEVILVDHNEFSQSAKGIENAKILRVVDHHKIGDFKTSEPLYYTAMPVGCTSTILYGMYEKEKIEIEPKIAGLMLSAIISDTLLFKSPTCTELDVEVGKKLAQIANVDVNKYGLEMLKAGTDLSDFTPEELINIDSKTFTKNEVKMQIAQVNTTSIEDVLLNKNAIESAMNEFIKENSEDLFILLITDILENNSQILVAGIRNDLVEKYNVPKDYIHVEVTESALTDNLNLLRDAMDKFHALGYAIWLDDFGSGYSSLNVLKDYKFDVLKIDMKFLSSFETNPKSKDIIQCVVDLAKKVDMKTLTEGVETKEQAEFLKLVGCGRLQGYLFGKPLPIADIYQGIESGKYIVSDTII